MSNIQRSCSICFANQPVTAKKSICCGAFIAEMNMENESACIIASSKIVCEMPPLECLKETFTPLAASSKMATTKKFREPLSMDAGLVRNVVNS